jgi:uncharacterized membrane protein
MNNELKTALTSVSISIVIGLISIYLCLWLLKNQLIRKQKMQFSENYTFAIISIGNLLSVGIIISAIIPALNTITKLYYRQDNIVSDLDLFKFCSFIILLCFIFIFLVNYCSRTILDALFGKINFNENDFKKQYIYSIILSTIFIAMSLVMSDSIALISDMLIPYSRL